MSEYSHAAPMRRRLASKRRATTEPYTRRSPRHVSEDAPQRSASGRGFFSRLISYIPLVGKMVADEENEEIVDEEDVEEEEDEDASRSDNQASTSYTTDESDQTRTSPQHNTSNQTSALIPTTSSSSSRDHPSTVQTPVDKRITSSMSRELVSQGAPPIKSLKIADGVANTYAFRRSMVGRRRHHPIYHTETAMSVIKQRKAISLAEYQRLSSQLRSLVDRTPVNVLALARVDQEEEEQASSASSNKKRWSSEQSVAALPSSKRARPSTGELPTINTSARVDGSSRRPRPSRLLTGEKRDAASRSAYSAAIAEKVLCTLKKIESPLDQETFKPRPSTSLSWAQHHLALSRNQEQNEKMVDGISDEEAPPTATVPKVAQVVTKTSLPNAPSKAVSTTDTPCTKSKTSNGFSPFLSPPSISMTPAPDAKNSVRMQTQASTIQPQEKRQYSFHIPPPSESPIVNQFEEDTLQYYFAPPPALREPPKQAPKLKKRSTENGSAAPFAFMPTSPKMTAALTKSIPVKTTSAPSTTTLGTTKPSSANPLARFMQMEDGSWKCPSCCVVNRVSCNKCPCCETNKPSGTSSTATSVPTSTSTVSVDAPNPLARFMKTPEGSWKCPTCSVTNEDKHSKCPCCETIKPSEIVEKSITTTTKTSGFQFGIVPSGDKPPVTANNASSGFTFQAPTVTAEAPVTKPAFTFGATPASTSSHPVPPTTGFVFGSGSSKAAAPEPKPMDKSQSFSFGVPKGPDNGLKTTTESASTEAKKDGDAVLAVKDASKPATGFSFGSTRDAEQSIPKFSFGAPGASSTQSTSSTIFTGVHTAVEKKSDTIGNNESTPAAPKVDFKPSSDAITQLKGESKAPVVPAFSFGAPPVEPKSKPATESQAPSQATPAFTFGKPVVNANENTEGSTAKEVAAPQPVKQPAFVFGQTTTSEPKSSESTSQPAFSFGGSTTASKTGFTFGSSADSKSEAAPPKPAFTFGQSSDAATKTSDVKASTPAFTFGGATTNQTTSTAPLTVFGNSPPKQTATFGNATPSFGQTGENRMGSSGFGSSGVVFGAADTTASAGFGASSKTPAFGSSTAQSTTPAFGSTAQSTKPAFGSTAQSTTPAFGSTAQSTTPAFGSPAQSTTPTFGSTTVQSTTPAFSFGSQPQPAAPAQSSFGFNATTTPNAFTTSTTDGFNSSNAFGASSGAVGGNPNSGFGSNPTSFGANAPSNFGFGASAPFGAPAAATPSAFGNAPFGAPTPAPTPSFGAPATGFGSTPSNASQFGAAPAFGTSQDAGAGGFSVGQAPTKRRILKAKRKSNVTR